MKIGAVSLGCDKNRVDSEKLLARLVAAGHELVSDERAADAIIINTCAFIDSAKEEAIDEILSAVALKKENPSLKIIVTGCLAQRYSESLEEEFPEVDAFMGIADYDGIAEVVESVAQGDRVFRFEGQDPFYAERVLTTPYHYAYLKIAEGCSNHCTYCAIPSIRGKYRSESMENLLCEAKKLSDSGVKELILVAQDVSRYGIDLDGKPHLDQLVLALEELDFEWIRLMYLEPEMVDDKLIEFVVTQPKVVKYMDIPLQHVDSEVLRRMNRHTDERSTLELVRKVKDAGISLRSTFICGFPGESKAAYAKLKEFVQSGQIDQAGFFAYSREEGTAADRLDGHLSEKIKEKRANELTSIQQKVMRKKAKARIGERVKVIYDGVDYDKQMFVGRMSTQAPDIDGRVLFASDAPVEIGDFYDVEIVGTDFIDLVGKVIQ